MKGQLQDLAARWFHLHWIGLLLFRVDLFCRLLGGFRMKDADTAKATLTTFPRRSISAMRRNMGMELASDARRPAAAV